MSSQYVETISVSPKILPPEIINTMDPLGSAIAEGRAYGEMLKPADRPRWVSITSRILIGIPAIAAFISSIQGVTELVQHHHSLGDFLLSVMDLSVPLFLSGLALTALVVAAIRKFNPENKKAVDD